jgi:3-isopropylmalate dehydrogenase
VPDETGPLRIAAIGGDGVGPEVVDAALLVLDAATSAFDLRIEVERLPYGADHYLATGITLPPGESARFARDGHAILVGALGDARIPGHEHARDILLGLRASLDLYVNERPARLLHPRLSPLARAPATDFIILRENTEGLYAGRSRRTNVGSPDEMAIAEEVHSRRGVERILRHAFTLARRSGKRLTLADKANAVEAHRLWREIFADLAAEFPDVEAECYYADALAMDLLRFPDRFGVVVTNNLLGDLLSDLAAALIGGPGVAPSANHHPGRRAALFEPVHGSAPTLVGTHRANPVAAILSTAMLLRHAGEPRAATAIESAAAASVTDGITTPDLGGSATTGDVANWIADHVARAPAASALEADPGADDLSRPMPTTR